MIHFPFSFLSVTLGPISYIGWNMHSNWCSKLLVRGFSQIMEKEVWFNELELCILLPNCCYYLAWLQYPSTAFRATKRPLKWFMILLWLGEEFNIFRRLLVLLVLLKHPLWGAPCSFSRACLGMEIRPRPASPNALLKHWTNPSLSHLNA